MSAVYVSNLVINSGVDFAQTFTLEDSQSNSIYDLTGYTVSAQMRKYSGSSNAINFTSSITYPATLGKILITLSSAQTTDIKPGRYVYDVVVQHNGNSKKTRVIEGMVLVREGVTR